MINGYWMADGYSIRIENVIFTTSGNTYVPGQWVCAMAELGETITFDFDNCQFLDYPDATDGKTIYVNSPGVLTTTFTNCVFKDVGVPIYLYGGTTTVVQNCLFQDWKTFGINVWFIDGCAVEIKDSAFLMTKNHGYGNGSVGVFVGGAEGGVVTIDHCDFLSLVDPGLGFAVQNVWSGGADVTITNCNIKVNNTGSVLSNSSTNASATLTYDYCNMNGTADAGCTGGANNTAAFVLPNYADVPSDWGYDNAELLTADSEGGALGSMLGASENPPVGDLPVMGALGLGLAAAALMAFGLKKNRK